MSVFTRPRRIRFSDCDPAGIVFYPQYFVLLNGLVEDWFDEGLEVDYTELVAARRIGLPTVRLEADFQAVSRLGDAVVRSLAVERLGQRSLTLLLSCKAGADAELRMKVRQVIVTTSLATHRSIDIPADIRTAIRRGTRFPLEKAVS